MARKLSGLETALEACEFFDAPKMNADSVSEEGRNVILFSLPICFIILMIKTQQKPYSIAILQI